jgi:hypothetical protein
VQESKALAALDHPGSVDVFSVEEVDGTVICPSLFSVPDPESCDLGDRRRNGDTFGRRHALSSQAVIG